MKVYVFLADGFETVEALGVIDVLRRGKVDVVTVSIKSDKEVITSHNIRIMTDEIFDNIDFSDGDMLVLPGGLKGTERLEAHEGLSKLIDTYYGQGKYLAAICAAPSILGHHNILNGRKATAYPGFEKELYGANATGEGVVCDGNVITAKGMGKTIDFALVLLEILTDRAMMDHVGSTIQYF